MSKRMVDRIFMIVAMVFGYSLGIFSDGKTINILYFALGGVIALAIMYAGDKS